MFVIGQHYKSNDGDDDIVDAVRIFTTVSTLTQRSKATVNKMLMNIASDRAAGRYVVWLYFDRPDERICRKKVVEFLQGKSLCSLHCYGVKILWSI